MRLSHGARPVHLIITVIGVDSDQWFVKKELSLIHVANLGGKFVESAFFDGEKPEGVPFT